MKNSTIVLDGTTGRPAIIESTVDGEDALIDTTRAETQLRLIDVTLESLVHDLNNLSKTRDIARSKAGYWRNEVKMLNERIDPIIEERRRRDDEAHAPEDTPFAIFDPLQKGGEEEPGTK